jgi:alpha-tubulin suppressor-like RCC1 family protein
VPSGVCECPDGSMQGGQSCRPLADSGTGPAADEADADADLDAGEHTEIVPDADTPDDVDSPDDAVTPDTDNGHDASGEAGAGAWVQVATGTAHTCAVIESGDVLCWGANASGQIGDGTRVNRFVPTQVPGIRAQSIAAGANKTCAVLDDGGVTCWGGLAATLNLPVSELPTDVVFPPTVADGVADAVAVAINVFEQCALLRDRTVTCWDWKDFTEEYVQPTRVEGIVGATHIAGAGRDMCAALSDGKVMCWALSLDQPPALEISADVRSMALGGLGGYLCFVLSTGPLQCMGGNTWGQLGNGTTASIPGPVSVLGLSQVTHLSVGDQHACAATESGELYCWGNKIGFGEVSATAVPTPTRIQVSGVVGISASKSHTCIALENGDVMCWGATGFGQVGDGTAIFAPRPRLVGGLR